MTRGCLVADAARQALADGPMGKTLRTAEYREFIACGYDEDLTGVATSCGIWVRACLHAAGRPPTKSGRARIGGALIGGWVEGVRVGDDAWTDAEGNTPEPGAILCWDVKRSLTGRCHVEVALEQLDDRGTWLVAAGGGGEDGTLCRLVDDRDIAGLDAGYRKLLGWWRPSRMTGWLEDAIPTVPDTEPAPPPESNP